MDDFYTERDNIGTPPIEVDTTLEDHFNLQHDISEHITHKWCCLDY